MKIFLCAAVVSSLFGCELSGADPGAEGPSSLTVMSWNMQALFDGKQTGNEYDEYRAESGWSAEKYTGRLTGFAHAINGMDSKPDILALTEIETEAVLVDLAGKLSPAYRYVSFANNEGYSLGTGLISRWPILKTSIHSIYSGGEVIPRPVLEVWIDPGNAGGMVFFVCHWKSKLGGEDETELTRKASAKVILRRIKEIRRDKPEVPVVIMGDLNENHDEFYRRGATIVSALMPDDRGAAALAGKSGQTDFLVLSKKKPPAASFFPEVEAFFTPWGTDLENGSYYYGNSWETIDHVLLSREFFDATGWEYESCGVLNDEPFVNSHGYPYTYNPKNGVGLSDHLPLFLKIRMCFGD
jgi:endonuclease/exonuclease/phosphatase family metal-dependent hydrolase